MGSALITPPSAIHPLDVAGQLPQAVADRAVAAEPEQIHCDGAQQGEHRCAGAVGVAVSVLAELGIAGPMPLVFNAPALPDQSQQGFWGGADAGDKPMARGLALPLAGRRGGDHLHDPGTAGPVGLDVLRRLFGAELPGGVAAVPFLLIRCRERDVTLSLELGTDLAVEGFLVGFDG